MCVGCGGELLRPPRSYNGVAVQKDNVAIVYKVNCPVHSTRETDISIIPPVMDKAMLLGELFQGRSSFFVAVVVDNEDSVGEGAIRYDARKTVECFRKSVEDGNDNRKDRLAG